MNGRELNENASEVVEKVIDTTKGFLGFICIEKMQCFQCKHPCLTEIRAL